MNINYRLIRPLVIAALVLIVAVSAIAYNQHVESKRQLHHQQQIAKFYQQVETGSDLVNKLVVEWSMLPDENVRSSLLRIADSMRASQNTLQEEESYLLESSKQSRLPVHSVTELFELYARTLEAWGDDLQGGYIPRDLLHTKVLQVQSDLQIIVTHPVRQRLGQLAADEFVRQWDALVKELKTDDVLSLYRARNGY